MEVHTHTTDPNGGESGALPVNVGAPPAVPKESLSEERDRLKKSTIGPALRKNNRKKMIELETYFEPNSKVARLAEVTDEEGKKRKKINVSLLDHKDMEMFLISRRKKDGSRKSHDA